jgi:hypothetical protein
MVLIELIERAADIDLVREMLSFAAEWLMDAEMEARTGASHGVRDLARQVQRNGYREGVWDTRAGRIELEIPRPRTLSRAGLGPAPGGSSLRSPGRARAVAFHPSWSAAHRARGADGDSR